MGCIIHYDDNIVFNWIIQHNLFVHKVKKTQSNQFELRSIVENGNI